MRKVDEPRGKYVCFEGGDGCGKSTLAVAVYHRLGQAVAAVKRFPSDGVIGSLIRRGLEGKEAIENEPFLFLFAADGLQEYRWIEDQLEYHGKHVLCDRHPLIPAKIMQKEIHPSSRIDAVYNMALAGGVQEPDVLFVIDLPVRETLHRLQTRDKYRDTVFERATESYVSFVKTRYLELAEQLGATVLDGTLEVDDLVDQVIEKAELR